MLIWLIFRSAKHTFIVIVLDCITNEEIWNRMRLDNRLDDNELTEVIAMDDFALCVVGT